MPGGAQSKSAHARRGGGGVLSQNALQLDYKSIMHLSWCLISLLTCCQKEVLRLVSAYIVKLQGILGYYSPPPPSSGHEHFLAHSKSVTNRDSNCLLVYYLIHYFQRFGHCTCNKYIHTLSIRARSNVSRCTCKAFHSVKRPLLSVSGKTKTLQKYA